MKRLSYGSFLRLSEGGRRSSERDREQTETARDRKAVQVRARNDTVLTGFFLNESGWEEKGKGSAVQKLV
jgi:hypothetical protein